MVKQIGVLIGRFQGYHKYHHEILKKAALENDVLVVLIGSTNKRQSIKNPFTPEQRQEMIEWNIRADEDLKDCRVVFRFIPDHPDNEVWASYVFGHVAQFRASLDTKINLYGCNKDASTFYLSLFPHWNQKLTEQVSDFGSTKLREVWFKDHQCAETIQDWSELTTGTLAWLNIQWRYDQKLQNEWWRFQEDKAKFSGYPYPEQLNFCCGDAVVQCHDYLLMIIRKDNGCLAWPGGHKNSNESFIQCILRELREETQIPLTDDMLLDCYVSDMMADNPGRSVSSPFPRISLAAHFDISPLFVEGEFPEIIATDDADGYQWVHKADIGILRNIHDDHAEIAQELLDL